MTVSADATIALWNISTTGQDIGIKFLHIEIPEKTAKIYSFKGLKREGLLIPTAASFLPSNLTSFVAGYNYPYVVQYDLLSV